MVGLVGMVAVKAEDEAEGEDGVVFDDVSDAVDKCVIESCAGWRLNRLPDVKAFIFQDFETKFDKTKFKEVAGMAPEAIFYNSAGKELERMSIENYNREQLNQLMLKKGIPSKTPSGHHSNVHEEEFHDQNDQFEFVHSMHDDEDMDYFDGFDGFHDEF